MTVLNLRQAGRELGFKTAYTLRKMLQLGVLDAYLRSGPDKRAVYVEMAPAGLPTLRQQVQAHTQCHYTSPLWRRDSSAADDWTARAAEFIDPSCWSAPPWSAQEWRNLRVLIELAVES